MVSVSTLSEGRIKISKLHSRVGLYFTNTASWVPWEAGFEIQISIWQSCTRKDCFLYGLEMDWICLSRFQVLKLIPPLWGFKRMETWLVIRIARVEPQWWSAGGFLRRCREREDTYTLHCLLLCDALCVLGTLPAGTPLPGFAPLNTARTESQNKTPLCVTHTLWCRVTSNRKWPCTAFFLKRKWIGAVLRNI